MSTILSISVDMLKKLQKLPELETFTLAMHRPTCPYEERYCAWMKKREVGFVY